MKTKDFIIENMDAEDLANYVNTLLEEMIFDTEEFIKHESDNIKNSTKHQEAA